MNDEFLPYDYSRCDMSEVERYEHEWNDIMLEIEVAKRMRDAVLDVMNRRITDLVKLADKKKMQWLGCEKEENE